MEKFLIHPAQPSAVQQYPSMNNSIGPGLKNLGSTCYVNVILQALFHLQQIVDAVSQEKQNHKCLAEGPCFFCIFEETLHYAQSSNVAIEPTKFVHNLTAIDKDFTVGKPQDAIELFEKLIAKEEFKPLRDKFFGGKEQRFMFCQKCNSVVKQIDTPVPCSSIQIAIEESTSIQDALTANFEPHKDDPKNKMHCRKCHSKQEVAGRLLLQTAPEILVFQLHRNVYNKPKISKPMPSPPFVKLMEYSLYKNELRSKYVYYKTQVVIYHHGSSLTDPKYCHYTCNILASDGKMYNFDDSMVNETKSVKDEDEKDNYVFFCTKIEGQEALEIQKENTPSFEEIASKQILQKEHHLSNDPSVVKPITAKKQKKVVIVIPNSILKKSKKIVKKVEFQLDITNTNHTTPSTVMEKKRIESLDNWLLTNESTQRASTSTLTPTKNLELPHATETTSDADNSFSTINTNLKQNDPITLQNRNLISVESDNAVNKTSDNIDSSYEQPNAKITYSKGIIIRNTERLCKEGNENNCNVHYSKNMDGQVSSNIIIDESLQDNVNIQEESIINSTTENNFEDARYVRNKRIPQNESNIILKKKDGLIKIGEEFDSFKEAEQRVLQHGALTLTQYYIVDSATLKNIFENPKKRRENTQFLLKNKPELEYDYVKFNCIHGGVPRTKPKNDLQPSITMRQGCGAQIYIRVDKKSNKLYAKKVVDNHEYHQLHTRESFALLPQQRSLRSEPLVLEDVSKLLDMDANRSMIQSKVRKLTGKRLTLKDLSNIKQKGRKEKALADVVKMLQEEYECEVSLFLQKEKVRFKNTDMNDSNNKEKQNTIFKGMFIQDKFMKLAFLANPQIIFYDGSYKMVKDGSAVVIIAAMDSNGKTEIIGLGIIVTEDLETHSWIFKMLIENNAVAAQLIRIVMTDKHPSERAAIRECLPHAINVLCRFHVKQIFSREITPEKRKISKEESVEGIKMLNRILVARNEDEYFLIYEDMNKKLHPNIMEYYNKHWHNERELWVIGLTCTAQNFLEDSNNRLEGLNAKVKGNIDLHSSFDIFFVKFFHFINSMRNQIDSKAAREFYTVPLFPEGSDPALVSYSQYLCHFAFSVVVEEYRAAIKEEYELIQNHGDMLIVKTRYSSHNLTSSTCDCRVFQGMGVICRHIIFCRQELNLSTYDETLCLDYWTKEYYFKHQRVFQSLNKDMQEFTFKQQHTIVKYQATNCNKKILTESEKRRLGLQLGEIIATALCTCGTQQAYAKYEQVLNIIDVWNDNKEAIISAADTCNNEQEQELLFSVSSNVLDYEPNIGGEEGRRFSNVITPQNKKRSISNNTAANYNIASKKQKFCTGEVYSAEGLCINNTRTVSDIIGNELVISQEYCNEEESLDLRDVRMLKKKSRRGRTRGMDSTYIKFNKKTKNPKNKTMTKAQQKVNVNLFKNLDKKYRNAIYISWVSDVSTAKRAMADDNFKIDEELVQQIPALVHDAVIEKPHKNVLLSLKKKFTEDAWMSVMQVLKVKEANKSWNCATCKKNCAAGVGCDMCLLWFDYVCAGVTAKDVEKNKKSWICPKCVSGEFQWPEM